MAISIDWATRVIYIPKSFTTLVQSTPIEVRSLDLNAFRLALKDLEDSEDGMPFLDTHIHNTEVILLGITYARVISIINGYTVTFENGAYAVNCLGANSNIGDVLNLNQVSVRISNAAGLISNQAIEYSSFNEAVTVDATSPYSGTVFPIGTPQQPVNNLTDALLIASVRGITTLLFIGDFTFSAGTTILGFKLYGEGMQRSTLTFEMGSIIANCELYSAKITGVAIGMTGITDCNLSNATAFLPAPAGGTLLVKQCLVDGAVTLPAFFTGDLKVLDCWSGSETGVPPLVDMNNSLANALVANHSGSIRIGNVTQGNLIQMDFVSGSVTLESTVTSGTFIFRGIGTFINNSSVTDISLDGLLNREEITKTTWSTVYIDKINGTAGTAFPLGTEGEPVSNLADALVIAAKYGITKFDFLGDLTIISDCDGLMFTGALSTKASTVNLNGHEFMNCSFYTCEVHGAMSGGSNISFHKCLVKNATNLFGDFDQCSFEGSIKVAAGEVLSSVFTIIEGDNTVFDLQGVACTVSMDMESGWAQFVNAVTGSLIELNIKGGEVSLAASCTGGEYYLEGIGTLFNDSAMTVKENHLNWDEQRSYHDVAGSFGATDEWAGNIDVPAIAAAVWDETRTGHADPGTFGATDEWASTIDPGDIASAVWDEASGGHQGAGTFGEAVVDTKNSTEFLEKHKANRLLVKDNKLTLYDDDNVTPILSQNLFDQNEVPTVRNVYHRAKSNVAPSYLPPSFSAFAISGQVSPLEVGASIAANSTFVWGTINSENVEVNSIALIDATGSAIITDHLPNTGSAVTTYPAITKTSVASHSFRIDGTNTQSGSFSRSYSVSWWWRGYYGESVNAGPLGESDIEGLRVGSLITSFAGTYSFLGGGYKYLCYPVALGKATSFIDVATQFNVPFEDAISVSVTNSFGVTANYWVHRSTNIMGGAISIAVS